MSSPQTREYATSTFSEASADSYNKPTERQSKPKRSLRQRVKSAIKDIGTSPFEYDDDIKPTAGWLSSMPPPKI